VTDGDWRDDPVLPEQTSDDLAEPDTHAADDDPDDLKRFLDDVPPHHGG